MTVTDKTHLSPSNSSPSKRATAPPATASEHGKKSPENTSQQWQINHHHQKAKSSTKLKAIINPKLLSKERYFQPDESMKSQKQQLNRTFSSFTVDPRQS